MIRLWILKDFFHFYGTSPFSWIQGCFINKLFNIVNLWRTFNCQLWNNKKFLENLSISQSNLVKILPSFINCVYFSLVYKFCNLLCHIATLDCIWERAQEKLFYPFFIIISKKNINIFIEAINFNNCVNMVFLLFKIYSCHLQGTFYITLIGQYAPYNITTFTH